MSKSITTLEEVKAVITFERLNIKSMIKAFVESPELTSQVNKLSFKDKKVSSSDIDKLTALVIERKFEHFIKNFKIQTKEEYSKFIDKTPTEELSKITENICKDVIKEYTKNE